MATIFRIADGVELTAEELWKYIKKNDVEVSEHYEKLKNAYNTDYDIFHMPNKPTWKPDNRIAVNFAKYIVDTLNGFFIGIPIKVDAKDETVSDYVNYLDQYNDQDDNNVNCQRYV